MGRVAFGLFFGADLSGSRFPWRGGRNTKPHAITDATGRPLAFHLKPGQPADDRPAKALLSNVSARCIVRADSAYDSDRVGNLIKRQQAILNIPPPAKRCWKSCFNQALSKGRKGVERVFCRLTGCRRIATRYDCRADIIHGSVHPAAAIMRRL